MAEQKRCRWSGWPGAWCLDCGREDPTEIWVSFGHDPMSEEVPDQGYCDEPGSNRHNPYHKPE